ncbi:HAMP domain-containing histidine kinase [Roseomonas sp. AR75]|uniref:HAMP domain-containing histidine kinase n=1 Tax=Roseomonas sp. AR75 TaxID=2562311 RepID=UPI0010C06865|nr:HAMP domain-containing histidine kinase [Roseomonas sp. AR75]
MDSDTPVPRQASDSSDLVLLRHDCLRRTAPAVQHEVNNAMMVLASNLEMLGRSVPEGPPRRQLERAIASMRKLDVTVRAYLDAARREAEDEAVLAPSEALGQALPLLRVALGGRFGFDLAAAEPDPLPAARLDRGRLDLALLRLVQDAVPRMAVGARITARGMARPESGEVALVLDLPPGAEPGPEAAALLHDAAAATGGRLEGDAARVTLIWPAAR